MARHQANPFFVHFFIPVITIVLLIVALGATVLLLSLNAFDAVVETSSRQVLSDARRLIDTQLRHIGVVGQGIAQDSDVLSYLNSPASGDERSLYMEYRVSRRLRSVVAFHRYVTDAIIVMPDKRMVITDTAPYDLAFFYALRQPSEAPILSTSDLGFHYMSIDTISMVDQTLSVERASLSLKLSLPLLDKTTPSALLVFVVGGSIFDDLFQSDSLLRDGSIFLTRRDGTLLLGSRSGDESTLEQDAVRGAVHSATGISEMTLTEPRRLAVAIAPSRFEDLVYVSILPQRLYFDLWNYVRVLLFLFLVFSVLVGTVFGILYARRESVPLTSIYRAVRSEEEIRPHSAGDLSYIVRRVAEMNRLLRLTQPVVRENAVRRLLVGKANDHPEELEALSIRFLHPYFSAVVVRTPEFAADYTRMQGILAHVLDAVMGAMVYEIVLGTTEMVVVLNTENSDDIDRIEDIVLVYAERLADQYGVAVHVGIGPVHEGLGAIARTFREARRAAEVSRFRTGSPVTSFREIHASPGAVHYPISLQRRLGLALSAGDRERANDVLREIVSRVFGRAQIPNEQTRIVFYDIINATIKTVTRLQEDLDTEVPDLVSLERMLAESHDTHGMQRNMSLLIDATCRTIQQFHERNRKNDTDSFESYIVEHFADPNLDLVQMACDFGYSASYFSTQFHRAVGKTFKERLTEYRMERAAELLGAGDDSVEGVLRRVGYTNYASFSRNFKRAYGLSPRAFALAESRDG